MGKGLVLYKSKYGATKKYAQMTAEEFGADLLEIDKWKGAAEGYDWVVFCGAIYASGISGLKTLKKYRSRMKDIPRAVFCVGASPYDEKAVGEVTARNMQGELAGVPLFYGRGAWNEAAMDFKDRTLCKLLQKSVAKQDPSTYEPWMKALMEAMGQTCDWTDRKYLEPLFSWIQEQRNRG